MKNIIKLIAVTTALLPLGQLQAKTFGGFAPKKTFTLTVTGKVVTQVGITTDSEPKTVPLPKGMINLSLDKPVTFTIGAKGQLISKGFEVRFLTGNTNPKVIVYSNLPEKPTGQQPRNPSNCAVYKNSQGEPIGAQVKFYQNSGKGLKRVFTTVVYDLKKK